MLGYSSETVLECRPMSESGEDAKNIHYTPNGNYKLALAMPLLAYEFSISYLRHADLPRGDISKAVENELHYGESRSLPSSHRLSLMVAKVPAQLSGTIRNMRRGGRNVTEAREVSAIVTRQRKYAYHVDVARFPRRAIFRPLPRRKWWAFPGVLGYRRRPPTRAG